MLAGKVNCESRVDKTDLPIDLEVASRVINNDHPEARSHACRKIALATGKRRIVMSQLSASTVAAVVGSVLLVAANVCNSADVPKWTYGGKTGPDKWGKLESGFAECNLGQFQSPIDIPDAKTRKGDFQSLLFNYKPTPLKIVDNGRTIQVIYAPGSFVSVEDNRYDLLQFHFHKPAEEKIDGKGHDMDVHLVHRGQDGKLAVIAVLLDAGKENKLLKTLMENVPKEKGKETTVGTVTISAVDLLPESKGYYRFPGSLTTPPCSESVTWIVLKTPAQVSADTIARFSRLYPMNARPVQPLNGRDIQATR
ncbi:MAG: carbonic anhydrase family protein [Betaproteobacteria bacterium]